MGPGLICLLSCGLLRKIALVMNHLKTAMEEKQSKWISIFLWGLGVAFVIFLLMWVRRKLNLTPDQDEIFFYVPHFLVLTWGIIAGLSMRNTQAHQLTPVRYPFFSIFSVMIFFDVIFSLWAFIADQYLDVALGDQWTLSSSLQAIFFSWLFLVHWTLTPFFIGYLPARFVRCTSDTLRRNKG